MAGCLLPQYNQLTPSHAAVPFLSLLNAGLCIAVQVGMHFMNPVPVMKLVELIRGMQTSDEVTHLLWSWLPCNSSLLAWLAISSVHTSHQNKTF